MYATLADATLPDEVPRDAVAALLRGCTVSDILMHLRDACRGEAARFAPDDHTHQHYALAADAIQHLRETTAIRRRPARISVAGQRGSEIMRAPRRIINRCKPRHRGVSKLRPSR